MKSVSELESDIRSDEALEALFAKAAARPLPRADREEQIRERVRAAWQQGVRSRQRRRNNYFAMAASVAIAAIIGVLLYQPRLAPVDGSPVAMVEKRFGDLRIADASGIPYYPAPGAFAVSPGQSINTGSNAGMALSWSNGGSLRLDEHTNLTLVSANEIYLQRGRIYFDSNAGAQFGNKNTGTLSIRTDHGFVTPLGTRYVTQHMNDKLMVMVRQGEVSVKNANFTATALGGQRLLVAGQEAPSVVPVSAYGDEWRWIEKTTPAWNTDGKTIHEFLSWVSRESGREFRFDSSSAENLARTESLIGYGQVDLEPSIALRVVLMTTDLDWSIEEGVVIVKEKALDESAGAT